jgi:hypothetical protein
MKVTSCRRPRLRQSAVKALHRRSFFFPDRTEPTYRPRWIQAKAIGVLAGRGRLLDQLAQPVDVLVGGALGGEAGERDLDEHAGLQQLVEVHGVGGEHRRDAVTTAISTAVVMVVAAVSPHDAWEQPILRAFDTAFGIAVGLAASWIGLRLTAPRVMTA